MYALSYFAIALDSDRAAYAVAIYCSTVFILYHKLELQ